LESWNEITFQNSDLLLREAIKEFSEQSYDNASLNRILQNSNTSKGVFYHYFHSKENLYLYVVGFYLNKRKMFLLENLTPEDMKGDIFHFIRKSITYSVKFASTDPWIQNFSDRIIKERGNAIYQKVVERYNIESDAMINNLVQNAIDQGNLREDFSVSFIRKLIVHMVSYFNDILETQGVEDYLEKIDYLISFMEYGLRKETKC
jgi:AcrR family transcriptional regulator